MAKMSNSAFSIMYVATILMIMNFSSIMLFWLTLELNMIMFISLIFKEQSNLAKNELSHQCLFYFVIQSMSSMIFLTSGVLSILNNTKMSEMVLILAITLKAGLIPLESWVYKMSSNLNKKNFLLILTIQKVPIFLLLSYTQSNVIMMILLTNSVLGAIYIWNSKSMKDILISSSIYTTLWLVCTMTMSMLTFWTMFLKYTLINSMIIRNMKKSIYESEFLKKAMMILGLLFLLGLPPMDLFFLKIFVINEIFQMNENLIIFILWSSTFMATIAYITKMINLSKMNTTIYLPQKKNKINLIVLATTFSSIMMYL